MIPCTESEPLLLKDSIRGFRNCRLSYWIEGLHLALPKTKHATQVMVCCCVLEVFQGCCSLIESLIMQYLVSRDKVFVMALVRLVFEFITTMVGDAISVLRTITGRETHWNFMTALGQSNGYSSDHDQGKGPSMNKIGAVDIYCQEIRSLFLNLTTLCITLVSLIANGCSEWSIQVVILPFYSLCDLTLIAVDILRRHPATYELLAAKSSLSGRSSVTTSKHASKFLGTDSASRPKDAQLGQCIDAYHNRNVKLQPARLQLSLKCTVVLLLTSALPLCSAISGGDQTRLIVIVLSYHNLYPQHRKLERNFEAIAKSRASMQTVLSELEKQDSEDDI